MPAGPAPAASAPARATAAGGCGRGRHCGRLAGLALPGVTSKSPARAGAASSDAGGGGPGRLHSAHGLFRLGSQSGPVTPRAGLAGWYDLSAGRHFGLGTC
jgi:hypothetical protein